MSIKDKLIADLKDAMKSHNKLRKDVITLIRSAIKQREVDERIELTDEDILTIISKQLKEKKSSIEDFKKGNREDLVKQTEDEMKILLEYLPKQLSQEDLKEIVKDAIDKENISSMKDIGKLMKAVMPQVKGKADGNAVNKIARELLN